MPGFEIRNWRAHRANANTAFTWSHAQTACSYRGSDRPRRVPAIIEETEPPQARSLCRQSCSNLRAPAHCWRRGGVLCVACSLAHVEPAYADEKIALASLGGEPISIGQGGTDAASTRRVIMASLLSCAEFALAVLAVATTPVDAAQAGTRAAVRQCEPAVE